MRKTISLVLAVLMMLVLLPAVKLSPAVAEETAKSYVLVTSADDLTAGTYLVASALEEGSRYVLSKDRGNNRLAYQVSATDENTISLTASQLAAAKDDELAYELKLGGSAEAGWSFYDTINSGYLYAASSDKNNMKVQAENDANGLFAISLGTAGAATVVAQGTNTRNVMRFNSSNNPKLFSCYAESSSVQNPVYLFKLTEGGVPEPSPSTEPEPSPDPNTRRWSL